MLGEWRRFDVYVPPSDTVPSRFPLRHPVLYLLDGETYFASVASMVQLLSTGENGVWALPELIVVAPITPGRAFRAMLPSFHTLLPNAGADTSKGCCIASSRAHGSPAYFRRTFAQRIA